MFDPESMPGIADDNVPNPGRIYDYLLGGNHNFEIDRKIANKLIQAYPEAPKFLRLIRWFLGEATRRLIDDGFTQFLDFASGLPVQDHIHQIAPEGTKVVYSDRDPITVSFAQNMLKDNPNVRYIRCNAEQPENILGSDILKDLFDLDKKTAIGMNGIVVFLSNDHLSYTLQTLYNWAKIGDRLFLSSSEPLSLERIETVDNAYDKMGQPFYRRSREELISLVGDWKVP